MTRVDIAMSCIASRIAKSATAGEAKELALLEADVLLGLMAQERHGGYDCSHDAAKQNGAVHGNALRRFTHPQAVSSMKSHAA